MNGIFLGRLCPIHLGHEAVIDQMIKECDISLILIGSCNSNISIRNLFSYKERRELIKLIYPDISIIGLPDYHNTDEWFTHLNDIIYIVFGYGKKIDHNEFKFYGGCEQDVEFFISNNYQVKIINRFDGSTPKISATEVRDCLIMNRNLDGLLNPLIIKRTKEIFDIKWKILKSK